MQDGLLYFFDIFGTFIFAVTGAVKGVKNRLDFLGVIVFAITVGCAGGMLRDVLLGATPVAFFNNYIYLVVCVLAGVLVFVISPKAIGRWSIIVYCDAVGLGVFTSIGCAKAEEMGVGAIGIIMSGIFTAVGGGILRDVFSKEIPMVFTSDFYASASILGTICFLILSKSTLSHSSLLWITAFIVIVARIIGYKCHLKLPVARMSGEEKR